MADSDSITIPPRVKDLTGRKFGRLTVVQYVGSNDGNAQWLCFCDCGSECAVAATDLTRRTRVGTKSCGCHRSDKARERVTTHGKTLTPEYSSWRAMIQRCYNPKNVTWNRYGGRGITVCARWRNSFEAFLSDMGYRPSTRHSIERLDNNGHYDPGNCKWATIKEQARNTSKAIRVEFNGRTQCISEWAEQVGISKRTIWNRLRSGWSVERALTEPVRQVRSADSSATPSL